jgi:hypothetical protein
MKSLEITGDMDSKRKLLMGLFWTNRKGARTEGCAPFLIEKIMTDENNYEAQDGKYLKLSDEILNEILDKIEDNKRVEFKISLGEEEMLAIFEDNIFSIETTKSKELEDEIIEKLKEEEKRKYPNICFSFPQRVGVRKYP